MNHYALKFAREAYEDALHDRKVRGAASNITDEKLAELKAAHDQQQRLFAESLPKVERRYG